MNWKAYLLRIEKGAEERELAVKPGHGSICLESLLSYGKVGCENERTPGSSRVSSCSKCIRTIGEARHLRLSSDFAGKQHTAWGGLLKGHKGMRCCAEDEVYTDHSTVDHSTVPSLLFLRGSCVRNITGCSLCTAISRGSQWSGEEVGPAESAYIAHLCTFLSFCLRGMEEEEEKGGGGGRKQARR